MAIFVFAPPPDLNITLDNDIYPDGSITSLPSTPGATGSGTLISYVVPAGKTLWVKQVIGSCRKSGKFTILNGATIVGTARVGAGDKNFHFPFDDAEEVSAGTTFSVTFVQDSGTPSSVEAFARGRLL
jgi:hypothetical protein